MKHASLRPDHLLMTNLPTDGGRITAEERSKELLGRVKRLHTDWRDRRREKTEKMLECWAAYFGTPTAVDWMRTYALKQTIGDVSTDWRHKVHGGKPYDIVETIVPYFKAASFPNTDWFDMVPRMPLNDERYKEYIAIMKAFMHYKLDECHFKDKWELFLRQLCIVGTSVIALPWRAETRRVKKNIKVRKYNKETVQTVEEERVIYNAPDIVVEDMLNFFLDPDADTPYEADLIRRMELSRAELTRLVEDEIYNLVNLEDIRQIKAYTRGGKSIEQEERDDMYGLARGAETHPADVLEVFEFWGCVELNDMQLYDVVVTWAGDHLLRVEANPFWCGKPFIVGTYTQVQGMPYGIGAVEPVLGLIHEKDSIKNQRLDGLELSINPMWGMLPDASLTPEDVKAEPGKVLTLSDRNSLFPLTADLSFAPIAVDEEQRIEQEVDKRTGTGSFVGSGQGRSGDRVTAAEVFATKEAGGNRLTGVYGHIEDTSLLPLIQRVYEMAQQFVTDDEIVPVYKSADEILYAIVGVEQLAHDMRLKPMGATHVADREFELRQRMDWVSIMNANPEMAKHVNWLEVAKDLTKRFLAEDAERFIQEAAPPPPQEPQSPEEAAMMQQQEAMGELVGNAQASGGQELANAVQGQIMADGGQNLQNMVEPIMSPQPVY